jgi:hypothetical protein
MAQRVACRTGAAHRYRPGAILWQGDLELSGATLDKLVERVEELRATGVSTVIISYQPKLLAKADRIIEIGHRS